MSDFTATPETGAVDAPASMDSVLAEFEAGDTAPDGDAVDSAVRELVNEAEEGDADKAADDGEATEPAEDGEPAKEPAEDAPKDDLDLTRMVTVKVDGAEVEVPLAEALKGYSREADYTKKTQALAEERRGLEAKLTTDYVSKLKQATDLFVQTDPILSQADQIDWRALAQEDPATYTQLRAEYDSRIETLNQARGEIQKLTQAEEVQRAEAFEAGVQATEQAIRDSDPSFSDDAKFKAYVNEGFEALSAIGLVGDDLKSVLSNPNVGPQVFAVLHDAKKWRAQQAAAKTLPEKRIVPVSQARTLKADASDSSKPTRRPPSSAASRDKKVDWVVQELLDQGA